VKGVFVRAIQQRQAVLVDPVGRTDWGWRRVTYGALIILTLATALLCIPFLQRSKIDWYEMNPWLQAITATGAGAALLHACLSLSAKRGLLFMALALVMSVIAEYNGTVWHLPFGYRYVYDPAVQPRIWSQLPLCVPPLWCVLAYTPIVFLRRMRVCSDGRLNLARLSAKVGLCSLYLMATDFFLDPLGISVGTWTWPEGGAYLGIPILNYVGWFLVGVSIFLPWFVWVKDEAVCRSAFVVDAGFGIASVGLTILCLAACVWRLGTWLPALLAGPVLVPVWFYWLRRESCTKPVQSLALSEKGG
jgi:uncharacterized membrane protein